VAVTPAAGVVRFGLFDFDPKAGQLNRKGVRVRLPQQPLQVLRVLVERPGEIVTRDELQHLLWSSNVFVDFDHGLNKSIQKLREALGDSAESPRFIETIPRIGYRFLAPVTSTPELPTGEMVPFGQSPPAANGSSLDGTRELSEKAAIAGRRKLTLLGAAAGITVLAVLAGLSVRGVIRKWTGIAVRPSTAKAGLSARYSVPLTEVPGLVDDPAFSPDGEKVAFFWDAEGNARTDLYVQLVGGEKPLRLTHTADGFLCCANWSPDGRQIAFFRCDDEGGGIYAVPTLGGSERKLSDAACLYGRDGYPEWTPDGKGLLIADRCAPNRPRGIVLLFLATGERRCLTAPPALGDTGDYAPKLSPDGKTVAFLRSTTLDLSEIYMVELSGKNLRQLTADGATIDRFMWSADGQDIIFNSRRKGLGRPWRVSAAGGAIEEEERYPGVGSLSRDGRRLAYVRYSGLPGTIWRARLAGPTEKRRAASPERIVASDCGNDSPQLSPDHRQLVFRSCRSGNPELWISDTNGNDPRRLTFTTSGWLGSPRWSPGGKWIAFDYRVNGHSQIQMIDADGRNRRQVTTGEFDNEVPTWSRDGASIYFSSNRTGSLQVWKRQVATGRETQITRNGGIAVSEASNADVLYYSKLDAAGIWSMSKNGGDEQLVTGGLHRGYWGHFAVTDTGIYLLDSDAVPRPMIMFYSFQTRRLTPLLQLSQQPDPWSPDLAASGDGRELFFSQGVPQNSIRMVENLP
jgi:Tol biopolymer transport system component/DNA-binding winged helix-turn-helix (wHTH) protein